MTADDSFTLAVLGCGGIAQAHAAAAGALEGVRIAACCDTAKEKADALAGQTGATSYRDYADLLAKEALDGAVICAPPAVHKEMALACFEAGVPVLSEKPLADTTENAEEMVRVSREASVLLVTAFVHRFTDLTQEVRNLLSSGKLGRNILASFSMMNFMDITKSWHGKKALAGGGVFLDTGVHLVDLVRYLFGEVEAVTGSFSSEFSGIDVEDSGTVLIKTKEGPLCSLSLSFAIPQGLPQHFAFMGTEGTLTGAVLDGIRYRLRNDEDWTHISAPDHFKGFVMQLDHFVKCASGQAEPTVTGEDGLIALRILEAAYGAGEAGIWNSL